MSAATFHSIWTLILFITIVGVIIWAYSKKRKASFDEAANLIFDDEEKEKIKAEKKAKGEDKQ